MSDKVWFVERMRVKLGSWETAIDQIQANADHIDPGLSYHYSMTILDLISRVQQVEKIIDIIKHSENDSWQDLRTRVQVASNELDTRLRKAETLFLQARNPKSNQRQRAGSHE